MFSNGANARIGKPETFFSHSLKLLNRLKRLLKTTFITGCLKRTKNSYSWTKKNIDKVMLASVRVHSIINYNFYQKHHFWRF
jgi:hypothetical protein